MVSSTSSQSYCDSSWEMLMIFDAMEALDEAPAVQKGCLPVWDLNHLVRVRLQGQVLRLRRNGERQDLAGWARAEDVHELVDTGSEIAPVSDCSGVELHTGSSSSLRMALMVSASGWPSKNNSKSIWPFWGVFRHAGS